MLAKGEVNVDLMLTHKTDWCWANIGIVECKVVESLLVLVAHFLDKQKKWYWYQTLTQLIWGSIGKVD